MDTFTFAEYARELWGPNWAVCRATAANKARYDRCITQKEYTAAKAAYDADRIISIPVATIEAWISSLSMTNDSYANAVAARLRLALVEHFAQAVT